MSKKKQHSNNSQPNHNEHSPQTEASCCTSKGKEGHNGAKRECCEEVETPKTQEEAQNQESVTNELHLEIEKLKKENQDLNDKYLRACADFENVKKRLVREKDQSLEYAYEKIAKDLLPSIDTLEMALKSMEGAGDNEEVIYKMKEGVSLTLDNLLKALSKHGIDVIAEQSDFDPSIHDAIMQVESKEHEKGQVVATMQKGYRYKDRILRPAMVSISK